MKTNWTTANIPSQVGRRALITGSNSGIGFETALALARRGAEVILPARTQAKADDAAARILKQVPGAQLYPEILDLAVQASVHAFANRMMERFPGQSLDLLINNAGVMALPTREITEDGFERQFATNYLGPFALTGLLLPSMKQRAGSRVVTVASGASNQGKIEFDNLQGERVYKPMMQAYAQSKLADLIFARELQRRLKAVGSPILSTAAHPGYAVTNLQAPHLGRAQLMMLAVMKPFLAQDAAHGALPTLYAAIAPEAVAGGYYGPDGFMEAKGNPRAASIPKNALDETVAKRLWLESERLTGVKFGALSDVV
ncbi:SDR family NAD(P)-dependent oxidoreductase [Granulicella sp. WH15]|uniref:oxidoreductase n=1 Tax=Granulicella sp. WH15 TaxID=2602070 RepID=UPI00136756C0|nr:oxidoreductase [Granulicella sp. WH15]QHN02629.1 SDR family NAD(P)-dependent oxidoreductase [Granulicella sp. WH15]